SNSPATIVGLPFNAVEGQNSSATVAQGQNKDPEALDGNSLAVISWGDGSSSIVGVGYSGSGGSIMTFSGSHAYAEEGQYAVRVDYYDDGGLTASTADTADGQAVVTDGPISLSPVTGSATVGQVVSGVVA